jgi:ascorbate-specific PTS system EIIC-type component UlaA
MELIKHTSNWVSGEVFQGKIMLVLGVIICVGALFILRNNNEILKGMLIPMALIILILIGYGSMQVIVRPKHVDIVSETHKNNPIQALEAELNKANKDDKSYSMAPYFWFVGIAIAAIVFFLSSQYYYKGLGLGLIGLFLTMLILDATLHHRLVIYLRALKTLV